MNRRKFLEYVDQSSLLLGLPALFPQLGPTIPRAVPARIEIPGAGLCLNLLWRSNTSEPEPDPFGWPGVS